MKSASTKLRENLSHFTTICFDISPLFLFKNSNRFLNRGRLNVLAEKPFSSKCLIILYFLSEQCLISFSFGQAS